MELISFGKEVLQNIAEHAASYRFGQSALRQVDRALWVVEKCARWAVPPPLDQDEDRPQPGLVRPLPWVFFLVMLVTLRVTRESISLINLVMGKPPLRSADVVTFIQSKRRYLRTLKYQGNRMMRARSTQTTPWYTSLYSLFELTMCFRKQSHVDNNNTTAITNDDELVVVKSSNVGGGAEEARASVAAGTVAAAAGHMERLIERMMVHLDAESDDDATYTLTNTDKSGQSAVNDTILLNESTPTAKRNGNTSYNEDIHFSPNVDKDISTPEKEDSMVEKVNSTSEKDKFTPEKESNNKKVTLGEGNSKPALSEDNPNVDLSETSKEFRSEETENQQLSEPNLNQVDLSEGNSTQVTLSEGNSNQIDLSEVMLKLSHSTQVNLSKGNWSNENGGTDAHNANIIDITNTDSENTLPTEQKQETIKQETLNFIQNEKAPKKEHKIANGRVKSVSHKKKGGHRERHQSNELLQPKVLTTNNSF